MPPPLCTLSGGTLISGAKVTASVGGNVLGGLTLWGEAAVISGSVAGGQAVTFRGTGGDLTLYAVSGFAAVIGGFAHGDQIDLAAFGYSSATTVSFTPSGSARGTLSVPPAIVALDSPPPP